LKTHLPYKHKGLVSGAFHEGDKRDFCPSIRPLEKMAHSIPCPECHSTGVKASLEEVESGKIYKCPHCSSRFRHVNEPNRGIAQGYGFGIFMGICSTVLFVLFIVISPSNPPWYYFVIGFVVLLVIHALMSRTVFSPMADDMNMKNLRKINDED
jgi:predicted RNA-binding Zn-ribbon protein involved in translation (DUF1610 family)